MSDGTHLMTWVTRDTKARFAALARQQGMSESALLKRFVDAALAPTTPSKPPSPGVVEPVSAAGRLSIRLRSDDLLVLRERATAREMPTSTYVSLLVRSHLRALTPLPSSELAVLKRSVAEIGAIGRNLNQIAHALNRGVHVAGLTRTDPQTLMRALFGLRDHIKSLVNTNQASWQAGHEKTNH
jgi:hypothetical protein